MKAFGRYRSDFISLAAMVAFFVLAFALNGFLSKDKKTAVAPSVQEQVAASAQEQSKAAEPASKGNGKNSASDSLNALLPDEPQDNTPEIKSEELAAAAQRVRKESTGGTIQRRKITHREKVASQNNDTNPISGILEAGPTSADKNFPIEELDNDSARKNYMAANKGIKVFPIIYGDSVSNAGNIGNPSFQDSADDDFIPFEKASNQR
jgi:hypothetical protein